MHRHLIPTELALDPGSDGWRLGAVRYPEAEIRRLSFQPEPLLLYQGTVRLRAEVDSSAQRPRILPLQLRLQACNDQVYLQPDHVELRVPIGPEIRWEPGAFYTQMYRALLAQDGAGRGALLIRHALEASLAWAFDLHLNRCPLATP